MERVERILNTKSKSELQSIILNIAVTIPVGSSDDFLSLLSNDRVAISQNVASSFDPENALSRIKTLYDSVEEYGIEAHFYESYSWDYDDDRHGWTIESDDGFSNEYAHCFNGAVNTLRYGFYNIAAEAFGLLLKTIDRFDKYHENDDEGALYFRTLIEEGLINVPFEKIDQLYAYSALMSQPEDIDSVFGDIYLTLRTYRGRLTFADILLAGTQPIPERDSVVEKWVSFLYRQTPNIAADFIKEAALLVDKQELLEDYVNTAGAKEPKAYKNLCELYIDKNQNGYDKLRTLAVRGLDASEATQKSRAELAGLLASAARDKGDGGTYLYAISERFRSSPSLVNFVPIMESGDAEHIERSINNLDALVIPTTAKKSPLQHGDYYVIHFLNKDYDLVFDAIKHDKTSLGWSYSLKGIAIPLFIGLLAEYNEKAITVQKLIAKVLERDVDSTAFYRLLGESMGDVTPEQATSWHDRCIKEAVSRIDAIVSGKHRGSYYKAAQLMVAICEMQTYRGEAEPLKLLYTCKEKYQRFSAFRGEVRTVLSGSDITGIKF
jgi:hypothetical protein